MKNVLIITAAGKGNRTKLGYNKMLYNYRDNYLINHTINAFINSDFIDEIIVTCSEEDKDKFEQILLYNSKIKLVIGGETRQQSVKNAVNEIKEANYVLVHDGARPNVSKYLLNNIKEALNDEYSCYAVGVQIVDTVSKVIDNKIVETLNRDKLYKMQTPQIVKYEILNKLLNETNEDYTDESSLLIANGHNVHIIKGEDQNFKITNEEHIRSLNDK